MANCVDRIRVVHPLFREEGSGSSPASTLQVCDLTFRPCPKTHAVMLVRKWHSTLPNCQLGPWRYAFNAEYRGSSYAAALWNNPSARCLPGHWLELRRMVCLPDSPPNTASCFLAWMVRYFRKNLPGAERLISYQDTELHTGTIYRAAGWKPMFTTVERIRDRNPNRIGTNRAYRSNINGVDRDSVSKIRWEFNLK
jgi:hypothetical protein